MLEEEFRASIATSFAIMAVAAQKAADALSVFNTAWNRIEPLIAEAERQMAEEKKGRKS